MWRGVRRAIQSLTCPSPCGNRNPAIFTSMGAVADVGPWLVPYGRSFVFRTPRRAIMKRKQLSVNSEAEALVAEQAVLLLRELRRTCRRAPHGHVLDEAEGVILGKGRELLRLALQASLQEQAQEAEKKRHRPGVASADAKSAPRADANELC